MWTYLGKEEEGGQIYGGKMRVREIMAEPGMKEDNTANRAAWMQKINSYTGDPR